MRSQRAGDERGPPAEGTLLGSRERRVSEADVAQFVALTGDSHPLHRRSQLARASPWGEPIAPGLLVLCLSISLVDIDPERVIALHRVGDVVFVRATRFGEAIHVAARIAYTRAVRPGVRLVGLRWLVRDRARSVLVSARIELLWDEGSGRAGADAER